MSTNLNVHNSLTYSVPTPIIDGPIEYVSYKPSGSQTFRAGETISIKLSSNTQFLNLERSYCKFNLACSTTGSLNPLGASSVFKSVQDQVSGLSIPESRNWYIQNGIKLCTDTSERKATTAACESFTGTGTGTSVTSATNMTVCMPVPTSISTNQLIPLAFFNAGHLLTYSLSTDATVVSAGYYTITNFEIVAALQTPHSDLMGEYARGLASGNSLKIAVQLYKSITSTLSASNNQSLNVQCGFISSLNTVSIVEKTAALGAMKNGGDLLNFYVNLDGQRYPKNKVISTGIEAFYQTLAGYSTNLSTISVPDSNQPFQQYSWKSNETFARGVPTANGSLSLELDFTGSTPVAGSTIECILAYDALLMVSQNSVGLVVEL